MAATARSRGNQNRNQNAGGGAAPANRPPTPSRRGSLRAPLQAIGNRLRASLPGVAGTARFRRELVGVALILVALLTASTLGRGGDEGLLLNWWGTWLRNAIGYAAPLLPFLIGLTGLRAFSSAPGPVLEGRHYLGGAAFLIAVVGLWQLGAGLGDPAAGGYLGMASATLMLRILGQVGAGLALFVGGAAGVFLLAGTDLQTFASDLAALCSLIGRLIWRPVRFIVVGIGVVVAGLALAVGKLAANRPEEPNLPSESSPSVGQPSATSGRVAPVTAPVPATMPAVAVAPVAAPPIAPPVQAPPPVPATVTPIPAARIPTTPSTATSSSAATAPASTEPLAARPMSLPTTPAPDDVLARAAAASIAAVAAVPIAAPPRPALTRTPVLAAVPNSAPDPEPDPSPEFAPRQPGAPPVINLSAHRKQRSGDEPAPVPVTAAMPLPSISRLAVYDDVEPDTNDLKTKAKLIEDTLASFKVEAWVREINPGPAVTQFALEPGIGVKVARITNLQNDLALALAAPSIRIEAPVPGRARVGLETPNPTIATVGLRETLESPAFEQTRASLPIPLGRDINGNSVVGDLTRMPHLLIAGATGAGKSVCLNVIISTFLLTKTPDQLRLLMIDPKMVELTVYNGVPHLQCPVVTEMDKVVGALRLTLREMERRYNLFQKLGVRNLEGYREKVADEPGAENLPHLVVIIDELADLMMTAAVEVEGLLVRLAQMARATGIHLIIATQRPSVDVLTGLIKANIPARIAFAVSSLTDSRVVLDLPGAERLLGKGDMLFLPRDAPKPVRVQGAFVSDNDAQYIVEHWHSVVPVPHYAPEWLDLPSSNEVIESTIEAEDDPLFDQALSVVRQQGTASASMLQRRLRVGYNRAARLIERMEDEGVIGPADGIRGRPVLSSYDD